MKNTPPEFCAFILTHGRPNKIHTLKSLRNQGYTGKVYFIVDDEDETLEEYKKKYGDDVIVFNKLKISQTFDEADNFNKDRRAIVYARNFCFEAAKNLGIKYFIQLDDDYTHFRYTLDRNGDYTTKFVKNLDKAFSIFIEYYKKIPALSIAFAQGGDLIGGGASNTLRSGRVKRKAMNTFFCSTDRPFQFSGRINEDVNTYTALGMQGNIFMTLTNICITQVQTQANKGGMTELYLDSGTYIKSFYTIIFCPSAVKIYTMGETKKRIHHKIKWENCAPCILRQELKKTA